MRIAVIPSVLAALAVLASGPLARAQGLDADALLARAVALHQAGDTLGAIENYEAALEKDPSRLEARSNLGAAYAQLGRYTEAIENYQAVLQKRYSSGLQTQVSYTFQKCMTNNDGYYGTWGTATQASPAANYWQNLYDPSSDYAQCYWDTKHVLSAYAVYELPIGRGKQFGKDVPTIVNAAVGNWTISPIISWHTGFPLALYGSDQTGTGSQGARQNCTGTVHYPKTVSNGGLQWFDPSFLSTPAMFTFGNCPAQGPAIGPGYADVDLGMQKNFPLTERMKLQFRTDFLNLFNHPQFAHPGGNGIITATQAARELQFALKFYF